MADRAPRVTPPAAQVPALDLEARIAAWSRDHDFVRAAILTSTRAVPGAVLDAFSDIDVILAVTDITLLSDDRGWLSDFGEVLVVYRDPIHEELGLNRFRNVTQYADGSKIDFTIWPAELVRRVAQEPQLLAELDVGYRVLVDKDHLTDGLQPPRYRAHIPTPPSRERFLELIEDFFLESTYVVKHLSRDDLLPLKFSLDHVMKQGDLRIMLEWRMEIDREWNARPGAAGKGLKKYLPAGRWAELERTYVGAGLEENWTALFDTIALFRQVSHEVASHLGYEYPQNLDDRVMVYLRAVQAESGRGVRR
jgi:aminoglycoside 6-adenylyltransferase